MIHNTILVNALIAGHIYSMFTVYEITRTVNPLRDDSIPQGKYFVYQLVHLLRL